MAHLNFFLFLQLWFTMLQIVKIRLYHRHVAIRSLHHWLEQIVNHLFAFLAVVDAVELSRHLPLYLLTEQIQAKCEYWLEYTAREMTLYSADRGITLYRRWNRWVEYETFAITHSRFLRTISIVISRMTTDEQTASYCIWLVLYQKYIYFLMKVHLFVMLDST